MVPPRYWKWPPLWMRLTLGVSPAARARTAREVTMVAANFMVSGEDGLLGVLVGGRRGKAGFLAFSSAVGGGRRASWRSRRRSAGEGGLLGVLVGGRRGKAGFLAFSSAVGGGRRASWRSCRRTAGEDGLLGVLVGGRRGKAGFLAFSSAVGGGRRPNDSLLGGWRGLQTSWRSRRRLAGEGGLLGVLVGGRRGKAAKRQSSSSEDFPLNDVSLPSSFPFYTHLRDSAVTVQRSLSPFRPKKKWAGPSWNFGWRRIGLRENSLGVPIRGIKFREFLAL